MVSGPAPDSVEPFIVSLGRTSRSAQQCITVRVGCPRAQAALSRPPSRSESVRTDRKRSVRGEHWTADFSWTVYVRAGLAVAATVAVVGAIDGGIGITHRDPALSRADNLLRQSLGSRADRVAALLSVTLHNVLFVGAGGDVDVDHPADAFSLDCCSLPRWSLTELADSARRGAQAERDEAVARRSDELKTALLRTVSPRAAQSVRVDQGGCLGLRQTGAAYSEEDRAELLAGIEEEERSPRPMVGNFLDASRLEAGAMIPGWRPNDMRELVQSVVVSRVRTIPPPDIVIAYPDDLPPVACEFAQIEQVSGTDRERAAPYSVPMPA